MIHPDPYDHLGALLADALVQFKSETALLEMSRKRESGRYTFLEVRRWVAQVAKRLTDSGVGPGDRVAIVLSNQPRWLVTATAAFVCGAVVVPLDYKLTATEQATLLRHCKPAVLVTEYGLWRRFSVQDLAQIPSNPSIWLTDCPRDGAPTGTSDWDDLPSEPVFPQVVSRSRDDLATIVYSSGTGGDPKGVCLSHGAYLSQLGGLLNLFPMARGDRYFSVLPTNHAIDFMVGFVGPFVCGATVVHQRTLRPEFLRSTLAATGITHMAVVPLLLSGFERTVRDKINGLTPWKRAAFDALVATNRRLTAKAPNAALSRRLLAPIHDAFGGRLKLLIAGGSFVDPDRVRFFYDLGLPVVVGYGLTEACTSVTVNRLDPFRPDSVGRVVDGVQVRIADPGPDGVGEVQVGGDTLMTGYLDDPEQTAAAFTADGWLRTGDLGHLDGAYHLHLVGRAKNMIVTDGGKNVYPEDIEAAFEGVDADELCVMAANYVWPQRTLVGETLVAVVRADDVHAATQEIREKNRRLADYKRVSGVLAWPHDFPRTASMKLKRAALAQALRERATPDAVRPL